MALGLKVKLLGILSSLVSQSCPAYLSRNREESTYCSMPLQEVRSLGALRGCAQGIVQLYHYMLTVNEDTIPRHVNEYRIISGK